MDANSMDQSESLIWTGIPRLSLLGNIVNLYQNSEIPKFLSRTACIGVQHILESPAILFRSLIDLGLPADNLFLMGKFYSTSSQVSLSLKNLGVHVFDDPIPSVDSDYRASTYSSLKRMWADFQEKINPKHIDRIIIFDDGGRCFETMPVQFLEHFSICGIEQTRGGLYSSIVQNISFPLIPVATSALKRFIEPPIIAKAIKRRIKQLLSTLDENLNYGIVGHGCIGRALLEELMSQNKSITVYDKDPNAFRSEKINQATHLVELLDKSDIVFSCTGTDITEETDFLKVIKKKTILVSCSSEDKEFRSLLKKIDTANQRKINPLDTIVCLTQSGHPIHLLRGGFPINFDNQPRHIPKEEIAVKEAAMLVAFIQGLFLARPMRQEKLPHEAAQHVCLDPYLQKFIINQWIPPYAAWYSTELHTQFNKVDWLIQESAGQYIHNPMISDRGLLSEEISESFRLSV
jgi:S-adenosylhomocysteine hydrolase